MAEKTGKGMRGKGWLAALGGLALLVLLTFLLWPGRSARTEKEKEGEIYEVVMENVIYGGMDMPDVGLVEAAVNAVSVPAVGCRLKILNVPIADQELQIPLMVRQGKKIDLINTGRTTPLPSLVEEGILQPISELLPSCAPELYEKTRGLLEACRIGGELYAVPASLYCGSRPGFFYNRKIADRLGLSLPEEMNAGELEELGRKLKEEGIYLTSLGEGGDAGAMFWTLNPEVIPMDGSQFTAGAYLLENGKPVLRNIYDTDLYLEYCKRMRRWVEEGFVPADSLLTGKTVNELFREEKMFLLRIPNNPIEYALQSKNASFPLGQLATGEAVLSTYDIQENGWGISATSENPEKAMAFLNLIYTNAEAANLLMNGIEGREYVFTGEGTITRVPGQEGNLGYARFFSIFGDLKDVYQWEPASEDFPRELEEFYGRVKSGPFLGYTFDVRPVAAEYLAVSQVLGSCLPSLECGVIADVAGAVEALRRELAQAGIDRIIEENQAQLDAWQGQEMTETSQDST